MFYIYIIYSKKHDKYYIGSTQNPWKRIDKHNTSVFNTFTSKYRPWELKAVFEAGTQRGEAEKIEKFIKKQKSKVLLQKLIKPNFVPSAKLAQLVRVPHVRD
ncbi:MAG: GIY-YIG nuclease family protein [Psychroflexus sp.]|nr:GIY-YIG nuclease family protein [Psychroflexus sp.]